MSPRRAAILRDSADGRSLREHLITTAASMISAQGTAGLTVRAIARQAGVADGVLYNHFQDKEELLAVALHAHIRAVEQDLGDLPEPGTATVAENLHAYLAYGLALHRAILPAFAGLLAQPAVLARFAEAGGQRDHWRDRLEAYLSSERSLARLAPDAQIETAVLMLTGVCHNLVLSALIAPGTDPGAPPPLRVIVTTVLEGIGR